MRHPSARLIASLPLLLLVACDTFGSDDLINVHNEGLNPPPALLHFPVALGLTPSLDGEAARYLFVANANFNLQYNAGTLQAYDLDAVDRHLAECPEEELPTEAVMVDEVWIPPYTMGLHVREDGERVYLANRSLSALIYVDVEGLDEPDLAPPAREPRCGEESWTQSPLSLRCNGGVDEGVERCGGDSVVTQGPAPRALRMPTDPMALVGGPLRDLDVDAPEGSYVLIPHRFGQASLFLETPGQPPELIDVIDGLGEDLSNAALDPETGLFYFTSTLFTRAPLIGRAGVALVAENGSLRRSFLFDAGQLNLRGFFGGEDTRDIGFVPAAESDELGRGFVVTRAPDALLRIDVARRPEEAGYLPVRQITDVGAGASRLALGRVGDDPRLFAFVSCFNARELYVIDATSGQVAAVVRGFSGPFQLAIDAERQRAYIADFSSSVVRIVDLAPLTMSPPSSPRIIATLGTPRPVSELQ